MSQVPELTLPELLDQPWVKRIARVMSFVAVLAFGGVSAYFLSLGNRITAIEQDRTTRIIKSDQNTQTLNAKVNDLQVDMDRVRTDVTVVKVDLAVVKGILQQMRQEQTASAPAPHQDVVPMPLLMTARQN